MRSITYDEGGWPLVRIRYAAQVNENEFETLLDAQTRSLRRAVAEHRRICFLYDATLGYHASPRVRKLQAEWIEKNKELSNLALCGVAFVFTSMLVRGVLTAVLWMSPMPSNYTITATVGEAEGWCFERLRVDGEMASSRGT